MANNQPCLNCERRHFGCHSECEDYLAMRDQRIAISQERNKDHLSRAFLIGNAVKTIRKNRRHK